MTDFLSIPKNTVFRYEISAPLVANNAETYRYLGYVKRDAAAVNDIARQVDEATNELSKVLTPRALYARFDLQTALLLQNEVCFCIDSIPYSIQSRDLARNLSACGGVFLFAVTLGPAVDRLIQKMSRLDTATALIMQAAGAMFTEVLADELQSYLESCVKTEGKTLKPRFSPGYGDVPLTVQKMFFSILECQNRIGLTLTDSLVMAPEKSVTAFCGITDLA